MSQCKLRTYIDIDWIKTVTKNKHILIVDDEPEMRDAISEYFNLRGFQVSCAASGTEMHGILEQSRVDVLLLDVGLQGEDGLSLIPGVRDKYSICIIVVSAFGDSEDRVLGLEIGADDYVVKPFVPRELLARIHSVLRRCDLAFDQSYAEGILEILPTIESCYDKSSRVFHKPGGIPIELAPGECDLLDIFIRNPNRAISRDELLEKTSHRAWEPFDRTIDVRVNRLRNKIEADPKYPELIRTVRGIGYIFKPPN